MLIAGGGIAALETALALRALAPGRAEVVLLAPGRRAVLAPYATLAATGGEAPPPVDLARAADAAGASLVRGRLAGVDAGRRRARLAGGGSLAYDRLVVAVGARRVPSVPGAIHFGGPEDAPAVRSLLERLMPGAAKGVRTRLAVVVPPGPGWPVPAYELALLVARRARDIGARDMIDLTVVVADPQPLAALGPAVPAAVRAELAAAGIAVRAGDPALDWAFGWLELASGARVAADRVVALPELRGPAIGGLPADALGFVRTDAQGRVDGLPGVDAVGDAASFPIKHGGLGAQQADAAAARIAADLGAEVDPERFDPLLVAVLLGGDVPRTIAAEVAGGRALGAGASWPDPDRGAADKVGGRFLAPFLEGLGARMAAVA